MKTHRTYTAAVVTLFALLTAPVRLTAQQHNTHPRYKIVDLGTFGGPQSYLTFYAQVLNRHGVVAGYSDTTAPDPNFPNFGACFNPDCLFSHGFQWQNGTLTDLGTLPHGITAQTEWISDSSLIAGVSENGLKDPITGLPEIRAVLWQNGQIRNLGTLGGT